MKLLHSITYAPIKTLKEIAVALGVILSLYQGTNLFFPNISKNIVGWIFFYQYFSLQ